MTDSGHKEQEPQDSRQVSEMGKFNLIPGLSLQKHHISAYQ